jgi:RNA polymerase sigma-B factor
MTNALGWHEDPESLVARYLEDPRPDLKDLILVQYAGLVERVARKFTGLEQQEDLVQVGFIGLLNALNKFDPTAGVRFNTYATYLVAGEIKHYLRDRSQTIRQPAWLQELRHKVNRATNSLTQELGRPPSEEEIADSLQVSASSVREVFQTQEMLRVASLDASPSEDEGDSDVERLDAADFCPEQLGMEDRVLLESAMKQLRDLERQVLLHFHFEAMNQTEIAAKLGISCNYVSHILRQSLNKLRKILSSEEKKDQLLRRQADEIDYDVIDASTGCYTEAYFHQRLQEELHRASCSDGMLGLAVIKFSGLDQLRTFYGEDSIVDFLREAGEFLTGSVRRMDLVCRLGKHGFGIILPATGVHASVVHKRLMEKLGEWTAHRYGATGNIAVKVGHASYPDAARSSKDLLEAAKASLVEIGDSAVRARAA